MRYEVIGMPCRLPPWVGLGRMRVRAFIHEVSDTPCIEGFKNECRIWGESGDHEI